MFPILFKFGPITLHTYGAFVAIGFLLGYHWVLKSAQKQNLPVEIFADLTWISLISGLLGARFLYVLFNGGYYKLYPLSIFKIWEGGLVWYGGILGAVLVNFIFLHRKKIKLLLATDVFSPAVALGHAFGRLGCFFAGCCYGKECHLPWAATFKHAKTLSPQFTPLHPTQIYEAIANFLLFFILWKASTQSNIKPGSGQITMIYVGLYSCIRFFIEFLRGDDRGPVFIHLTSTQWISIGGILLTFVLLYKRNKNA